jgi:hypothetical protein
MAINYIRVINQQVVNNSVLIDKIDRSQGNFTNYAQIRKQPVYVPYVNAANTSVKGYVDLVPTDEVLLSAAYGTIYGLSHASPLPYVSVSVVASNLVAKSNVTNAVHGSSKVTITGTVFSSVAPDVTKVILTNTSGVSQTVSSLSVNTSTSIEVLDSAVSIGTPGSGWTVQVFANSKYSNVFTIA